MCAIGQSAKPHAFFFPQKREASVTLLDKIGGAVWQLNAKFSIPFPFFSKKKLKKF
jgi:hypothetical protein